MRHSQLLAVLFALICGTPALADETQYVQAKMDSAVLSAFWGQPVSIDAHILLPDSFYREPERRFPIIYWIQGFGGTGYMEPWEALHWQKPMRKLKREFIIVYLDGMFNGGHQEFADSANNGPWGTALTTEFIPQTEKRFHALGTANERFVAGHSSGGWSALWLQVTYPDLFGGEWSISPDPVDFRNFTGPDLEQFPSPNFFTDSSGRDYDFAGIPLRRAVLGEKWERRQFESFDAVFSPAGSDGTPEPLFDRSTGVIDASVAHYWDEHYDIAKILRDHWAALGPKLRGKLHIVVGTKDQYHLNEPVALLQTELQGLGSDAEIHLVPGFDHFTIFQYNNDVIGYVVSEASSMSSALASDP